MQFIWAPDPLALLLAISNSSGQSQRPSLCLGRLGQTDHLGYRMRAKYEIAGTGYRVCYDGEESLTDLSV